MSPKDEVSLTVCSTQPVDKCRMKLFKPIPRFGKGEVTVQRFSSPVAKLRLVHVRTEQWETYTKVLISPFVAGVGLPIRTTAFRRVVRSICSSALEIVLGRESMQLNDNISLRLRWRWEKNVPLNIFIFHRQLLSSRLSRRLPWLFQLLLPLQRIPVNPFLMFLLLFRRQERALPPHHCVVELEGFKGLLGVPEAVQEFDNRRVVAPFPEASNLLAEW